MLFPQAEELLDARVSHGRRLQRLQPNRSRRHWFGAVLSQRVFANGDDVANLADIEGTDFDIVNKDLVDYYYDCED